MVRRVRVAWRRIAIFTIPLLLTFGILPSLMPDQAALAQQRATRARAPGGDAAVEAMRKKVNANTVSIVSGNITGSYLRYAADIASVVDDGDNMRVLPILSAGAVQNVSDILFLKGVDMGMVRTDSVEALRREGKYGGLENSVQYIARLVDDEMHVVASRDITDIRQLAGKKVNFDVVGSGTHFSCELIFERLGIKVDVTSYEQSVAYQKMRTGEIAASIFFGGTPVIGITNFDNSEGRFHLVPVPFDQKFADYYLPARLTAKTYPNLLGKDEQIDTVAAPTLLAVANLKPGNERYERVARFVDAFFSKFSDLTKPPRHPKWREVNLTATAPGWTRFKPAQDWLEKVTKAADAGASASGVSDEMARFRAYVKRNSAGATLTPEETVRLFEQFKKGSGRP